MVLGGHDTTASTISVRTSYIPIACLWLGLHDYGEGSRQLLVLQGPG